MELPVEQRQRLAHGGVLARLLAHPVEGAFLSLGRALDDDELAGLDGVQRAGDDLAGLLGILRADLPELGDVQILQRARAHRGRDADRGVVGEGQRVGAVLQGRGGSLQSLVELVVGVLDLVAEDDLGIVELVGDDAGPGVRREDAGIEIDQAAERGEAELAGLEDDVGRVQVVEQRHLGAVRPEGNARPGLVGDRVEVRQPPARIEELARAQSGSWSLRPCSAMRCISAESGSATSWVISLTMRLLPAGSGLQPEDGGGDASRPSPMALR